MTATATITVPLRFPVDVPGADGKPAKRTEIELGRPKTRHVKRLAVLLGADLARMLVEEVEEEAGKIKVDAPKVAQELINMLLQPGRLDDLTAIVADMCREHASVIDELDPVDLFAVGKAFLGFFPELTPLLTSLQSE